MLIVLFAAVLGMAVCGAAGACECEDATSVTMGWPVGTPPSPATMGVVTPGYKEFYPWATASPDCNTQDLVWTNQSISGVTVTWTPNPPVGGGVTIKLQNLPSSNSSFGQHWVKASVDGKYAYGYYRLFFMPYSSDHPLTPAEHADSPNWFYYWRQTSAGYQLDGHPILYDGDVYPAYTSWMTDHWQSWMGWGGWTDYTPPDGDNQGIEHTWIDTFGYWCRHEARHLQLDLGWWPNGIPWELDADEDTLPDSLESELGGTWQDPLHGGPFSPSYDDTNSDGQRDDDEYVLDTQWHWSIGSADDEDWAKDGRQYPQS